jgi:aspartate dehydrogenase
MRKVGLIGFGAIGRAIAEAWPGEIGGLAQLATILVRPGRVEDAAAVLPRRIKVTCDPEVFLAVGHDAVIEAAGHEAVAQYGEAVLTARCELHLLSVGALADAALAGRLEDMARRRGGRVVIPTGALAGFDGLRTLRVAGLRSVRYTSIKPVAAWRMTTADALFDLEGLTAPQVIFTGSAREAARAYPRNANLAAAVALAGLGFEETQVELVADPAATLNTGRIDAVSAAGRLQLSLAGGGFSENPKTSRITAMSVLAAIREDGLWLTYR